MIDISDYSRHESDVPENLLSNIYKIVWEDEGYKWTKEEYLFYYRMTYDTPKKHFIIEKEKTLMLKKQQFINGIMDTDDDDFWESSENDPDYHGRITEEPVIYLDVEEMNVLNKYGDYYLHFTDDDIIHFTDEDDDYIRNPYEDIGREIHYNIQFLTEIGNNKFNNEYHTYKRQLLNLVREINEAGYKRHTGYKEFLQHVERICKDVKHLRVLHYDYDYELIKSTFNQFITPELIIREFYNSKRVERRIDNKTFEDTHVLI